MRTVLASKVRKQNTELNLEFGLYKDGKIIFKYLTLIYELYCLTTVYQKKKKENSACPSKAKKHLIQNQRCYKHYTCEVLWLRS